MGLASSLESVTSLGPLSLGAWAAGLYVLTVAVYRLYFHPLAKYPGPFWARLTSFPSYWHTLQCDRHIWLWRLQQQYGPTFRYAPESVLINTSTAYKTIFGPKGNVGKSYYYDVWVRNVNAHTTWSSTNPEMHARKRRVLNHAFSDRALRSAEPFVISNVDRWCQLIADEIPEEGAWSGSLNMADWVNYLIFDILGDLCFGKSFDMKEHNSTLRYVPDLMVQFMGLFHPIAFAPFAAIWAWMKPYGLDYLLEVTSPSGVLQWRRFVEKCLADRTQVEEDRVALQKRTGAEVEGRKDFFHYLFQANDPETGERGYSLDELYGECEMLIIAGSDTTSTVQSSMYFYLARHPEVQDKLAREIAATFPSADEIRSGPKLNSCRYLRAFVQESLRVTPPVAAEPSRVVRPGGTVVDGHFFPEGMRVSAGLYCLSYNEDVFPEPFSFRPERWLGVGGDDDYAPRHDIPGPKDGDTDGGSLAESASFSFSMGQRGCPGRSLAWLEMTIIIAKILYHFEIRRDPASNLGGGEPNAKAGRQNAEQYQTYDCFVSRRDGPLVQFKKRVHG
jgi:cytochrome P450